MGAFDDVKIMQQEGKSAEEIKAFLGQRGISGEEAARYIAQANIRGAVVADNVPSPSGNAGFSTAQGGYQTAGGGQDDEMQPSMLAPQQESQEVGEQYAGEYPSYQQQQDYYGQG